MNALVVFDTVHGNTEKIARAIGKAIRSEVQRISEVDPANLKEYELLIIGSPTHGGFPTEGIQGLLKACPALEGISVAAFDTRTKVNLFGRAAPKIARGLEKNGATLRTPPDGFFVLGTKGPLKDGELERAATWAKAIAG